MALGDIRFFDDGVAIPGAKKYNVNVGTYAIQPGELVYVGGLGNAAGKGLYATAWTNSAVRPSIGTDYLIGVAATAATNTGTAKGTVTVVPNLPGTTYLIAPSVAANWDTQSEYDALVGARVYITVDSSSTRIGKLLSTSFTNGGCTVEPLDISVYPGLVRFSLNQKLNYTNN